MTESGAEGWLCPRKRCRTSNPASAESCGQCRRPRPDLTAWLCQSCSAVNRVHAPRCVSCQQLENPLVRARYLPVAERIAHDGNDLTIRLEAPRIPEVAEDDEEWERIRYWFLSDLKAQRMEFLGFHLEVARRASGKKKAKKKQPKVAFETRSIPPDGTVVIPGGPAGPSIALRYVVPGPAGAWSPIAGADGWTSWLSVDAHDGAAPRPPPGATPVPLSKPAPEPEPDELEVDEVEVEAPPPEPAPPPLEVAEPPPPPPPVLETPAAPPPPPPPAEVYDDVAVKWAPVAMLGLILAVLVGAARMSHSGDPPPPTRSDAPTPAPTSDPVAPTSDPIAPTPPAPTVAPQTMPSDELSVGGEWVGEPIRLKDGRVCHDYLLIRDRGGVLTGCCEFRDQSGHIVTSWDLRGTRTDATVTYRATDIESELAPEQFSHVLELSMINGEWQLSGRYVTEKNKEHPVSFKRATASINVECDE